MVSTLTQNKQNFLFNGEEVETSGNPLAHVILRGSTNEYGKNVPNFYYDDVLETIEHYEKMGLEIHSSLLIQTMITQVNVTWNKSVSFVKP